MSLEKIKRVPRQQILLIEFLEIIFQERLKFLPVLLKQGFYGMYMKRLLSKILNCGDKIVKIIVVFLEFSSKKYRRLTKLLLKINQSCYQTNCFFPFFFQVCHISISFDLLISILSKTNCEYAEFQALVFHKNIYYQ